MPLTSITRLNLSALCRFSTQKPPEDSFTHLQLWQISSLKNAPSEGGKAPFFIPHRAFAFAARTTFHSKLSCMYGQCGSLADARKVFDMMKEPDLVSWNTMIAAYRRNGYPHEAVKMFRQMQQTGFKPDQFIFASVLPACAKMGVLEQGMNIHQRITEGGFLSDITVGNALLDMYAKCGSIYKARKLFDRMAQRDVVSWNAMIAGYAQNGFVEKASRLFEEMPHRNVLSWTAMIAGYAQNGFVEKAIGTFKQMALAGVKPNSTTFVSILPACAKTGDIKQGVDIHQIIKDSGISSNVVVATALIDMYAKCGNMDLAFELFERMPQRNVVSWTAMIVGYAQNGFVHKTLETFKKMQLAGVKPDSTTFASVLPACAKKGALNQGMEVHQRIMEGGFSSDILVGNALLDMYAKCGRIDMASELFDRVLQKDVVSWNAMIAGYTQNGLFEKALETFKQMQLAGVKPDSTTFASILPACAKMGALEQGMDIHRSIMEGFFDSDIRVGNALIDMYAKCGSIAKAHELFDRMPQRDVVSWNVMIAGCAQNGFCEDALNIFELMKHSGTYPDSASFACVLCACSHAGLVDEGCTYFNYMGNTYCITPSVDHYVCMVDLVARAGYLEDTLKFIIKMPVKPVAVVWLCFLSACRSHMNIGLGVYTATLLFYLYPENTATYVLLSNIYGELGRWGEAHMVRRLMKDRGIRKIPGCSWIENRKMVHAFYVGDASHPQKQGSMATV